MQSELNTLLLNNLKKPHSRSVVSQSDVRIVSTRCLGCSRSRLSCLRRHLRRVTTAYYLPLLSSTARATLSTNFISSTAAIFYTVVEADAPTSAGAHANTTRWISSGLMVSGLRLRLLFSRAGTLLLIRLNPTAAATAAVVL